MSDSIAVIHHMARAGGTLVARCIGAMQGIALLSEIHPFANGGRANPLAQARDWLGIDVQAEAKASGLDDLNWLQAVELIHRSVRSRGDQLVVRDWSHLDFTGVPWVTEPRYKLTTAEVLASSFDLNQAAIVRHPVTQWESLRRQPEIEDKLDVRRFLKGYRAFAELAADIGFVRFEEFTLNPASNLQTLCGLLKINYDPAFESRWKDFTSVTNNAAGKGGSMESRTTVIESRQHSVSVELAKALAACADFVPSLELLGYQESPEAS